MAKAWQQSGPGLFASNISPEFGLTEEKKVLLLEAPVIGVDTETTNDLQRLTDQMQHDFFKKGGKMGLSIVTDITHLCLWCDTIPFGVVLSEEDLKRHDVISFLIKLFGTSNATFVGHNIVFDMRLLLAKLKLPLPKKGIWNTLINETLFGDADPKTWGYIPDDEDDEDDETLDEDDPYVNTAHKGFSLIALLEWYKTIDDVALQPISTQLKISFNKLADYFSVPIADPEDLSTLFQTVYPRLKAVRSNLDAMPGDIVGHYVYLDTVLCVMLMRSQIKRIQHLLRTNSYPHLAEIIDWENRFTRYCCAISGHGIGVNVRFMLERMDEWVKEANDAVVTMRAECEAALAAADPDDEDAQRHKMRLRKKGFSIASRLDQQLYFMYTHKVQVPDRTPTNDYLFTDTGKPSFNKKALSYYLSAYPQLESYANYTAVAKKITTAHGMLAHLYDGHVFSQIDAGVVTGRTRSSNINLQNPQMKPGLHWKTRQPVTNFPGCFHASPGNILIGHDISNGETWMGAWLAKDNAMMDALYTGDFHTVMAKTYFPFVDWDNCSSEEFDFWRGVSKGITFGNAYGMGAEKMAKDKNLQVALKMREDQQDWRERIHTDHLLANEFISIYPLRAYLGITHDEVRDNRNDAIRTARANIQKMSEADWAFCITIFNADGVLKQKAAAYPATAHAKRAAQDFAQKHGYVELWDGRRVFMRHPHKAWNALCQGGLGVVGKRWCVLLLEKMEEYPFLEMRPALFVHDENVIEAPIQYARIASKITVRALESVMDTHPYDKTGTHWSKRTERPIQLLTDVDHSKNQKKWGYMAYQTYPFGKEKWADSIGLEDDLAQASTVEAQATFFLERRYTWPGHPQCAIGETGLALPELTNHLRRLVAVKQDSPAEAALYNLDRVARSFQKALGEPVGGLETWLQ